MLQELGIKENDFRDLRRLLMPVWMRILCPCAIMTKRRKRTVAKLLWYTAWMLMFLAVSWLVSSFSQAVLAAAGVHLGQS